MVNDAKIALSPQELQLVTDTGWILTKRAIIEKVYRLFGELAVVYTTIITDHAQQLPGQASATQPKISKGENYLQLPYVVLDHPRYYDKEDTLAIRTMFWWGNFFSITLHVSGKYKTALEKVLWERGGSIPGLFICINEDQWQHHFEDGNYIPLAQQDKEMIRGIIHQRHFIKVAVKFSLQQWNDMPVLLERSFREIVQLLKY